MIRKFVNQRPFYSVTSRKFYIISIDPNKIFEYLKFLTNEGRFMAHMLSDSIFSIYVALHK